MEQRWARERMPEIAELSLRGVIEGRELAPVEPCMQSFARQYAFLPTRTDKIVRAMIRRSKPKVQF